MDLRLLILLEIFGLSRFTHGWLSLESDVPMGHSFVELRIRDSVPTPLRTEVSSHRLPKSISTVHYDLEIRPILDTGNPDQYKAPGQVVIRIKCLSPTSSITLHARFLDVYFQKIQISNLGDAVPVKITGFRRDDDERAFLVIFLNRDLTVNGEYLLKIPFTAWVADPWYRQSGIYRAEYQLVNGTKKWLAITQFQKAYAREAFPCFDEPSRLFKATFTIKIGRREGYQSFSNMERDGEPVPISKLNGWVWDVYKKSMLLPVYAIGFAVASDYASEDSPPVWTPRISMKTWIPKSLMTNTSAKFAATASAQILKFYEKLFDYPYYANKFDNFAADMNLWGMENFGFIVYRPAYLIWTDTESTTFEKWNGAALIAHEISHMWFGNLVTCEFWDDFWIQEGMARYLQFIGAQFSGMDFRATDRFVLDATQWAMMLDEGPDSVPVHSNETNRVIYQPFQIEYDKGSALIRMMQTFLTEDTFLKGIRLYIKRHQFNNTVQDDFFQAMTDQALMDGTLTQYTVKEIMDTWTKTRGFPIIRVSRANSNTLYISQLRFVVHPNSKNTEQNLWYVPIWYTTKSKPEFNGNITQPLFWMDKDVVITYFHVDDTDEWIIVNPEARGYYRVIYDDHLTQLLISQLESKHTVFDCATRSQLIDDYFRSALARFLSVKYAMDLTWYLPKEDDLIVWTTVFNNFRSLYIRLVDTSAITPFRKYILRLVLDPLKRLGVKQPVNDTASNMMLRGQLLDWVCAFENEFCTEYAHELFNKWMSNPSEENPIPVDIQPQIYCATISTSLNYNIHNFLLNHYKTTKSSRQKNLVIKALACDQSKNFIKQLIDRSIFTNLTDIDLKAHGRLLLESLVKNPIGRDLTLQFLKAQHKEITRTHGAMAVPKIIAALVPYASSKGKTKLDNEIISFISMYLRQNNIPEYVERSLQTSAQNIVENSYWMEYFFFDLKDWLMLHVKL